MINRISSYVFLQIAVGLIMVTVAVTCIVWLSQSLRFIEMIVNRGLSVTSFVALTGLMMPNFLNIILPIAVFIVTVFFYHKLIMDREMVIMRAAGMSSLALAKPAITMALFIVAIGYVLSIFLVPASYNKFREMQWDIRYNFSNILLREGAFNEVAKGITVYVRDRSPDGQLLGILAHDGRVKGEEYTLMAESGAMVKTEDGARVIMLNGSRQSFDKNTNQLSMLHFDRYLFDMDRASNADAARFREPRELTMTELFDVDAKSIRGGGKFTAEIHRRIIIPWAAMGFSFIALASLMSGNFTRRGGSKRVLLAVAMAGIYQSAILTSISFAGKQSSFTPFIYIVTFAPMIIGMIVLSADIIKSKNNRHIAANSAQG